jgi:hypothetical protein
MAMRSGRKSKNYFWDKKKNGQAERPARASLTRLSNVKPECEPKKNDDRKRGQEHLLDWENGRILFFLFFAFKPHAQYLLFTFTSPGRI